MMETILCNLDSITYESEGNFSGIKVDGWAFSTEHGLVEVSVDRGEVLWSRIQRNDVEDVYKEKGCPSNSGFHMEIFCTNKDELGMLHLYVKDTNESVNIDLKSYFPKKVFPKKKADISAAEAFRMRITDNVCYRFENFWKNDVNNTIIISGWAFDNLGTDIVRLISPVGENQKVSRQDVKEYYEDRHIDAMCGFEITINAEDVEENIVFSIGSELDAYILSLDLHKLSKMLKTQNNIVSPSSKVKRYVERAKNIWKYGESGAEFKEREYQIFMNESNLNRTTYQYSQIKIPQKWIEIQKKRPEISVLIPIKNISTVYDKVAILLQSLEKQSYSNFKIIFCGNKKEFDLLPKHTMACAYVECEEQREKADILWEAIKKCESPYWCVVEQEDCVDEHFLFSFIESINLNDTKNIYFADYDVWYEGEALFPVRRRVDFQKENADKILIATMINCRFSNRSTSMKHLLTSIKEMQEEKIQYVEKLSYHAVSATNQWKDDLSKIIAFYLPQFHETPENNEWWGKGFTEWVNVKRGYPMFEGHDQPRIPADLGYYDLVEDDTIQKKQVRLANDYNIFGFCFYYYWFKGRRLLHKPIDQYVNNPDLNLPFCICWANETWSRRWDGAEKEILIQQVHNEKTDKEFINDVIPLLKDKRYITVDGRPILLLYRIELFPRPAKTIERWRKICRKQGVGEIHVALVQSFGMVDHRIYGADSSVEFPPHKIVGGTINDRVLDGKMKEEYTGNIYSYQEIVENQMLVKNRDYKLWPGAMLRWDNTARRLKAANVFHEFTPDLYRKWLIKNHTYTKLYNTEPYMFVNAWNEWAEGTYLEPDKEYGCKMLEISSEVVKFK